MHSSPFCYLIIVSMEKIAIEELTRIVLNCRKCPLGESRLHPVLGKGSLQAKIMIVGEGPGATEDQTGVAFTGPAGKLLDKILASVNISKDDLYFTNIVKCFPPENRTPRLSEQEACLDYLRMQFLLIHPKMMILLGSVAAKKIIDPKFSVMSDHGKIFEKKGVIMIPTFHPAALLRDETKKPAAWEDWKIIRKTIDEKKIL
jgi:uracil-DNA glycosylase family 4